MWEKLLAKWDRLGMRKEMRLAGERGGRKNI